MRIMKSKIFSHREFGRSSGPSPYELDLVNFNGTSTYGLTTADFDSNADGKKGLASFWFNAGADGTNTTIKGLGGNTATIKRLSDSTIEFIMRTSLSVDLVKITSSALTAASGLHHVMASWDIGTVGARHLYVDDVSDISVTTFTDGTIDYTRAVHTIGAASSGAEKYNGSLGDYYFANEYLALPVEANRRKLITADLRPVFLGELGELPTTNQPIVFMSGKAVIWNAGANKGYGGDIPMQGAVTDA